MHRCCCTARSKFALLATYHEALAQECAEASDDVIFNRALASCCAGWLAGLCSLLPSVREEDKRWGRSTNRQRIVAGLDHFAVLSDEVGLFPGLAEAACALGWQLRQAWPATECKMRLYPAFAGQ
jgi:hypothetical protein